MIRRTVVALLAVGATATAGIVEPKLARPVIVVLALGAFTFWLSDEIDSRITRAYATLTQDVTDTLTDATRRLKLEHQLTEKLMTASGDAVEALGQYDRQEAARVARLFLDAHAVYAEHVE